jgi:hypothetical protein
MMIARVRIGRLEYKRPTTVEEIGDPVMLHDSTRLTDGIEASDDPILAMRRSDYEVSVAHRTGGWKGCLAALEWAVLPLQSRNKRHYQDRIIIELELKKNQQKILVCGKKT